MRIAPLLMALASILTQAPAGRAQPELSDKTLSRPSVGLTASLPVGASMSSYEIAGRGANRIILPGDTALVNVTDVTLTKAQTLREVADSIIRQRLGSVSSLKVDPDRPEENVLDQDRARGSVLSHESHPINGWPAELFYLEIEDVGGERSGFGYALFMPTANTVAMFELQTVASEMERVRPYFELIVNSVVISDPSLAASQRAMGVEAGVAFIQSLSPGDYESVIEDFGSEWRYERFYRPASSGSDQDAVELGYRRTRFALGTRADLKTREERGRASPEDRQKGYLVFQEARILDHDRDMILDVAAGFFMTPDRRLEGWSIRQAAKPWRRPGPSSNTVETGIREGDEISIARSVDGKPVSAIQPAIEGTGYISRAEVYMLPHLLIAKAAPATYRFYAFNQLADRVTLREDTLEEDPQHAGAWKYISRPSEASPGQTTYFTSGGEALRAELPNEQLWEPIPLKRLFDLWKDKGMPTN